MKDDELIITNEEELGSPDAVTAPVTAGNGGAAEVHETGDGSAEVAEPQKQEETFREALESQIHEEDTGHGHDISVIKILGGDFFTAQILRRQVWLMLLIACFVVFYISNRYSCQKSLLEIDKLKKELTDVKYKALSTSSRLTEISRQSHVVERLKENRDSTLHIADQPPFIVQVPEQ
ncbi:MAG: FtsL-like putative cell division protein [Bacteroidales bacterium]|nr:FtsL-like putative cell division protein [Bacteroidales bacterium]MCM1146892.1 FtsL-like putative cell division protein [Bacteroidales bacterium]MCM1205610.1 FtsL-like putative cell division protein [Bacillota bacterium]MCM1510279.1 FtsL-like putative cell division protein [Clostridium sp.]